MILSVDYSVAPPLVPTAGGGSGTLSFDLLELLAAIGILTTASYPCEFSLSYHHAFSRYFWLPEGPGPLRIRRDVEDIDFHQKTLISDELGVGVAGLVANRLFGVRYFADAYPLLKRRGLALGIALGPRRSCPDFVALDAARNFYVIEAKGTQSATGVQAQQIRSGLTQKANLIFAGRAPTRMVIATRFAREGGARRSTETRVVDPEFAMELSDEDRRLVLQEHFLKLVSCAGVIVRRKALQVGQYRLDSTRCVALDVGNERGIGRELRFQAMRKVGEFPKQIERPRWYRLRLGVLAETYAAIEAFKLPEIAKILSEKRKEGVIQSQVADQKFSYISPDGLMMEFQAVA